MEDLRKKYPILSPVQLVQDQNIFGKKSQVPGFSEEIYYIFAIKRPILSNQTFLFKLIDASGRILNEAFSIFDIKKTTFNSPDQFEICKIVSIKKEFGKTFYNVKLSQFPQSMIFKIERKQLQNFKLNV